METTNQQQNNDAIEIDLVELLRVLWSKIVLILGGAVLTAVLVFLFEFFLVTPQYVSTTKLLVLVKQQNQSLNTGDLSISSQLTKDYVELIQTREVTERTIRNLGLMMSNGSAMTHEQMLSKLTVTQTTDTRIITISVEDPDPEIARDIANELRDVAAEHIKTVVDAEAVNVVDYANLPTKVSTPRITRDTVIGGVAGFVIVCAIILVLHLMDNTIKTSEDIEKYLGISTLGSIPLIGDEKAKGKKSNKKYSGVKR